MKPSDKLSPKTRMAFGSAAEAICASMIDTMARKLAMLRFIKKRPTPNVQRPTLNDSALNVES
jgi:hypothetical protein